MSNGPQKPDHRGNFAQVPKCVVDSVAWRHASLRARVVLLIFQQVHNGFNNGEITLSIKQIGRALGDQCHGANARAVAELIELGFLECTSDACHSQSKARSYRVTFISSGKGKPTPATNDYLHWRPSAEAKRAFGGARTARKVKFGGAVTATPSVEFDAVTATPVKFHDAVTATGGSGIATIPPQARVAVTAPILVNQSTDYSNVSPLSEISPRTGPESIAADFDDLRAWVEEAIAVLGYGGAKILASKANVPQANLSRFRSGKALSEKYRLQLHEACARILPKNKRQAAA